MENRKSDETKRPAKAEWLEKEMQARQQKHKGQKRAQAEKESVNLKEHFSPTCKKPLPYPH